MKQLMLAALVLTGIEKVAADPVPKMDVVITSRDGVKLKGTYFSPGGPGPGIVLFHQCDGSSRGSWGGFPGQLAAAGFHVLTFDNRGTGESGRGREAAANIIGDAEAAYSWLAWQRDVDRQRMSAGGASCGVAQAANLAAGHPQIKALVLLSGLVPGSPMKYLATAPGVAVFGASSTGDMGAGNVEDLARASKHPQSTAKHYPVGGAHGVGMFARDPELRPAIVKWLQGVMK
jgi:dienelactone hydrolase